MANYSQINKDHVLAITHFVKVKNKYLKNNNQESLEVTDLAGGTDFHINGLPLINNLQSADEVNKVVKTSRTNIAEILISSYGKPITVCFDKVDGSQRTMRGKLIKPEPLMGRSMVEDLDINDTPDKRLRQVDHRSLHWLIIDGIKYEVKK